MTRPELDDTALPTPDATATAPANGAAKVVAPGLTPGQQLGHFRIDKMLGAGGMGEVYLATDLALDRPVAIKVLPEHLARDTTRRDRMIKEARAQARVTHPNVGHIYFIGEDAGRLYFAMEYVEGKTLADAIASGPLPIDEALAVTLEAARGLREAQRKGFTHRDVKPSNLMVDRDGHVKVLDFGLAAGHAGAPAEGPVAQTSLAGTPLYMAPEQARGQPVDLRADIYALGATLYHLATGKPPFSAETLDGLATLHATAARPTVLRRDQPRSTIATVDSLCAKMMAPRPEDRFASYDELIQALEVATELQGRPAGFWARTIALGMDALVAFLLLGFLSVATPVDKIEGNALLLSYALIYTTLCVGRFGQTLGKALIELEVVDVATGRRPSWRRSTKRALVMFGLPFVVVVGCDVFNHFSRFRLDIGGLFVALWFLLCGIRLVHASARVQSKRTPWDKGSGTLVRYRVKRRYQASRRRDPIAS